MLWWVWMVLGCGLLVLEVATPGGLFFLFFGFGAILTGAIVASGIALPDWGEWLLFSVLSVLLLLLLRNRLKSLWGAGESTRDFDGVVGSTGVIAEPMGIGSLGQVELRGARWSARNVGTTALTAGQRCVVVQIEGLTVLVRAE